MGVTRCICGIGVYREPPGDGPPTVIDPADADSCPESFRFLDPESPFLTSDGKVHLIRVERVRFIARGCGVSPAEVKRLAEEVLASRDAVKRRLFEAQLASWARSIELRPVYCAYLEDALDLFGDSPAADPSGWADTLRDRLGLIHLDPGSRRGPIDVLVFRYPVSTVARLRERPKSHRRPLVPPTVLDGSHSPAFFPAPRGSLTGHAVDLAAEASSLFREVLHPSIAFRAKHLWRTGTIRRPVDRDNLPTARGMHVLRVRQASGRADYAETTDRDLL